MDLLPIQCEGWKQDYQRTIETNENLYGMGRPDYAAVVRAVQTAVLDVTHPQVTLSVTPGVTPFYQCNGITPLLHHSEQCNRAV